jgi:hypothetical protein
MRTPGVVLAALLTMTVCAARALAGDATGPYAPYEDLVQVLADFSWHARDDVYRFPPPKDPLERDLALLTLRRLEGWEKRYPGRLRDVTVFGRARALERLGEYRRAADAYREVATSSTPLASEAATGADRAQAFADAAALPEEGDDLTAQLTALRRKLDAWAALAERYRDTPHEALVLVEEERLESRAAGLVTLHRQALEDGEATAERALRFLIEKHAESKNLPTHILRLADLYAGQARDYVDRHHRPLAFVEDDFLRLADRAMDAYRKVATWDGTPEKPEGQARFAAFEAYRAEVLARYR